jgi:hypothetical protein
MLQKTITTILAMLSMLRFVQNNNMKRFVISLISQPPTLRFSLDAVRAVPRTSAKQQHETFRYFFNFSREVPGCTSCAPHDFLRESH